MAKVQMPDMDKMPSNSANAKKAQISVPESGGGIRKKKKMAKLTSSFLNDDAPRIDIVSNVIEPGVKNLFLDILSSIADTIIDAFELTLFKGETRSRRSSRRGAPDSGRFKNGYIDYSKSSNNRRGSENDHRRRWNQDIADFSDIGFPTFNKADETLGLLREVISKYEREATVADLYRLSKLTPRSPLDSQWGWDDLSGAYPIRDSSDPDLPYTLVMPEPHYIGRK